MTDKPRHSQNSRPSIDHSILSPSGRVSKRARDAAMKRENDRLFPPGFWDKPESTEEEKRKAQAKSLLLSAKNLRDLAARGMSPGKFKRAAADLERQARDLIGGAS